MNISAEWVLGLLVMLISGSYVFTGVTYLLDKRDRAELWKALAELKDNHIKHLAERVTKLEKEMGD